MVKQAFSVVNLDAPEPHAHWPSLMARLVEHRACAEAKEWVQGHRNLSAQELWDACDHPSWMLWILMTERPDIERDGHETLTRYVVDLIAGCLEPPAEGHHPSDINREMMRLLTVTRAWMDGDDYYTPAHIGQSMRDHYPMMSTSLDQLTYFISCAAACLGNMITLHSRNLTGRNQPFLHYVASIQCHMVNAYATRHTGSYAYCKGCTDVCNVLRRFYPTVPWSPTEPPVAEVAAHG